MTLSLSLSNLVMVAFRCILDVFVQLDIVEHTTYGANEWNL